MIFTRPSIMTALKKSALFTDADLYQARLLASLASEASADAVALCTALLARAIRDGHVCLEKNASGTQTYLQQFRLENAWEKLAESGVVGQDAPLCIAKERLYFSRHLAAERLLSTRLKDFTATPPEASAFLPDAYAKGPEPNWQDVATFTALRNQMTIITGGPGTGKTTTVARIVSALSAVRPESVLALGAPTGKAAARMDESLRQKFPQGFPKGLHFTGSASTLHRLLGWTPSGFRHHRRNPLPVDILIIDEMSMVDLELAASLFEALPPHARLILLGDQKQLASVEAGAVLASLCTGQSNTFSPATAELFLQQTGQKLPVSTSKHPLRDHVIELQKSYRFSATSGIAQASHAICTNDTEALRRVLATPSDLTCQPCATQKELLQILQPLVQKYYAPLTRCPDPSQAFELLKTFCILTPFRHGPRGVSTLNTLVSQLIFPNTPQRVWYAGRPVIIQENDYTQRLFNGDVGITLPGKNGLRVFFPSPEGYRALSPARLPAHETCYAMTVHKSQGSEFHQIAVLLPTEANPLFSQELLYTAITRAQEKCLLMGDPELCIQAAQCPQYRTSGLADFLRASQ